MLPKFSLIVPVYNVEKYLHRCLDSILAQTFTNFELLLVDDGSKDLSGKICDEYAAKDKRIQVFHKENGGVSSARNVGISNARGAYISFIDSDDWVEKTYLEEIISNIGDADIMFFSFRWMYEDGCSNIVSYGDKVVHGKDEIEKCILFLKHNDSGLNLFGYTWNKVFKAEIIKKNDIKFIENLSVSEDEIFTLAFCINANCLRIMPALVYNYRWTHRGLTHCLKTKTEWIKLAEGIDLLIKALENKTLIDVYRYWYFRVILNICSQDESFIVYFNDINTACKFARHYKITKYKRSICKNIILMICSRLKINLHF